MKMYFDTLRGGALLAACLLVAGCSDTRSATLDLPQDVQEQPTQQPSTQQSGELSEEELSSVQWPVFRGDPLGTGFTRFELPAAATEDHYRKLACIVVAGYHARAEHKH